MTQTMCADHPAFEADYCPSCGTSTVIGEAPAKPLRQPTGYVLHELKPRVTGFPVRVLNLDHEDADRKKPKGVTDKFGVLCVRHNKLVTAVTRREAHRLSSRPTEWCGRCHPRD